MAKILLLIIAVTAFSCRSVRTSESITKTTDSTARTNITAAVTDSCTSADSSKLVDNSVTADSTSEVTTEVEFTPPDSVGHQYPTKVTITEKKSGKITKKNIIRQSGNKQESAKVATVKDNSTTVKAESEQSKEKETTKQKTPAWVWITSAVISIGLVFLAYLVLKKFRLVK